MQGIFPVFVLEGEAPTLKHKTIARRNDIRSGFQEKKTARKVGRTQFNRILNECKQLLRYMGITCIQSNGEAEALCAYLNEDGVYSIFFILINYRLHFMHKKCIFFSL